jgi:parvulin-like peptidyl-prolyl isomerase
VATLTTPKNAVLTVTEPQFYAQLQNYVPNTPPQTFAPVGQSAGRLVLQQLMQNLIVEGLAQDEGVAPTDAEINTQFNNIKLI